MRLATPTPPSAAPDGWRDAVRSREEPFPLNGATPVVDLRDFLDQANWRRHLQALGGMAGEFDPLPVGTRLAAPVPNPRQLIIAGANTYSHFKEARSVFDLSLQLGPR